MLDKSGSRANLDQEHLLHLLLLGFDARLNEAAFTFLHSLTAASSSHAIRATARDASPAAVVGWLHESVRAELSTARHLRQHFVLLSGGLDSRAILFSLRAHLDASQVSAVTYGPPDSTEVHRARHAAHQAGVEHHLLDTEHDKLRRENILGYLQDGGPPVSALTSGVSRWLAHRWVGDTAAIWSGFLGDPPTKAPFESRFNLSWAHAVDGFIRQNRACPTDLLPPNTPAMDLFPDQPFLPRSRLNYPQQLDMLLRQYGRIQPSIIFPGYHHMAPFDRGSWKLRWQSVPQAKREQQALYRRALQQWQPQAFAPDTVSAYSKPAFAIKGLRSTLAPSITLGGMRLGRHQLGPDPQRGQGWRLSTDPVFRGLVHDEVRDLAGRNALPWVDGQRLLQEQTSGSQDHGRTLAHLASLELLFKSGAD